MAARLLTNNSNVAMEKTSAELHLYANSATGLDTNDGLTAGTAVLTIPALIALLPDILAHNTALHLSGSFALGADARVYLSSILRPGVVLLVSGDPTAKTVVADDGGSPWTADISSVSSLGLSTAGWTPNAYAGDWVRISSGPASGQIRLILEHTATTLTPAYDWTVDPGNCSFDIVKPSTTISATGNSEFHMSSVGAGTIVIQYISTDNIAIIIEQSSSSFKIVASHLSGKPTSGYGIKVYGQAIVSLGVFTYDTATITAISPGTLLAGTMAGVTADGQYRGIDGQNGAILSAQYSVCKTAIGAWASSIDFSRMHVYGSIYLSQCPSSTLNVGFVQHGDTTTVTNGTILVILGGAAINDSSGFGVIVQSGATIEIRGAFVGSGNALGGVHVKSRGAVLLSYGAVPTITGNSGTVEISFDGTTEVATWAEIDAGLVVTNNQGAVLRKE